jgi:DinB superfamily
MVQKELNNFLDNLTEIAKNVEFTFGHLSIDQINWKPHEHSWSIGQCLEHLIVTNKLEFPAIKKALTANYKNPFFGKIPLLPSIFGKVMIYFLKPESTRKFKAPKSFQPSKSEISKEIVQNFLEHQKEFIDLIKESENLNHYKTKILSPISDLIAYSLADAFLILVVHEKRHINQAERVLKLEEFPQ